ncbi:MAG: transketolase [Armatimonadetes bacterium]|nr:transketolase [Armatimonadota bacterium]
MQKLNVESDLSQLAVNTIRLLSVDMVEKAKSGHPGMPCGAADFSYVLWTKFMRYNPLVPDWPNRDRFILSAGHGSALLYSMLHLMGNPNITLDEVMNFRQWNSKTPGHPEYCLECGIETTTGPLGQGFANGVGMAIAQKMMAQRFNRPGFQMVNHRIFGIVSEGDLMEGISHEAASIAGHLGLGNMVYIYDDNHITIEGSTDLTYSEDVEMRFKAYGWHVQKVDGHDRKAVESALTEACAETGKPSIILARTTIGYTAPTKAGTHQCHGEPLGAEEVAAMKKALGWPPDEPFYVPDQVRQLFAEVRADGEAAFDQWNKLFAEYSEKYPDLAELWDTMHARRVPEDITDRLLALVDAGKEAATRDSGGAVLQEAARLAPSLCGGSADLAPSTKTYLKDYGSVRKNDFSGRNFHFGIREHAMGAVMNGMALYGGFIPFGSTFFVFSDYMRPAIRISALNHSQAIYVFTHDSFFVGEDGPTHQPIEHLAGMRILPNTTVIRPADAAETAVAWAAALKNTSGPTVLALSRQKLPPINPDNPSAAKGVEKGAYVVSESPSENIDAILIATGSEVHVALEAQKLLAEEGIFCRVVSMPSFELFDKQTGIYRESVLPRNVTMRVAIEAGVPFGWERYVGSDGLVIGMNRFGASAPANLLAKKFGLTPEVVAARVRFYLAKDSCGCFGQDTSMAGLI